MWMIFGIQLGTALLFLLIGWAIRSKRAYWLISNFNGRPKDEQEQLIETGLPQKTGALLITTAAGMLALLPLLFTSFKYAIEVEFGFMLVFLLGGLVYLSKYELPHKRKKSYIISSSISAATLIFVGVLTFLGYQDFELKTGEDSFEITGMYGDRWKYEDIKRIEMMGEMPEVTFKRNGFGLQSMAKGLFTVKGYGASLLFIHKENPPYLYIETADKKIFINGDTPEQTKEWHEELKEK